MPRLYGRAGRCGSWYWGCRDVACRVSTGRNRDGTGTEQGRNRDGTGTGAGTGAGRRVVRWLKRFANPNVGNARRMNNGFFDN